jgi:hypothetical protein
MYCKVLTLTYLSVLRYSLFCEVLRTAIIFVYSTNWLVSKTQMECVCLRAETLNIIQVNLKSLNNLPWLRWLIVGLSPWRPGFDPSSAHVRFMLDKVALGQVLSPRTSVSP